MPDLRLSLSCGYYDRTLPILAGLIKPEGIELDTGPLQPGAGMGSPEADVYELPLPAFAIRHAREPSHLGLPIIVKRTFFQQLVLTRKDAPVDGYEDWRGKKVGLLNWYQHAMGVWTRGHLRDAYGILPEEMHWFTLRPSLYPLPVDCPVDITLSGPEADQVQMLLDGQLDVLIHEGAHRFLRAQPGLRRMLPDFRAHESAYFADTGCFPINHLLCIRREIVEANPWVTQSLLTAFEQAKVMALDLMERNNAYLTTPWLDELLEAQQASLGADPYPNGLAANRPTLERFLRHLHEQQLTPQRLAVEEIFAS